jgi:flagellar basal body-associated protein FliL
MKSCLGLLIILLVFTLVVGGGALIWHLSSTAEFSRKTGTAATSSATPPKAIPVSPPRAVPVAPPKAVPVREPARR